MHDLLYCDNHPDRVALERCEVCGKPLCAYCLYYTDDGQRLCEEHAAQARSHGVQVEEPAFYAEQLVSAQAGGMRKRKREAEYDGDNLYRGNSNDLMALVGLMVGGISMAMCCGGGYCLPFAGFLLSLVAVINAKNAYDPKRTRRLGLIGLLVSGVWVAVIGLCIFALVMPMGTATTTSIFFPGSNIMTAFYVPSSTPSQTPTVRPEPTRRPTETPSTGVDEALRLIQPTGEEY